jgi:hypothetical protein
MTLQNITTLVNQTTEIQWGGLTMDKEWSAYTTIVESNTTFYTYHIQVR